MRLPDFINDVTWNDLRSRMKADLVHFTEGAWENADLEALLDRLQNGIDVDLPSVTVTPDGTFEYNGVKVLIYIKDQKYYAGYDNDYKFHICNCKVIEEFRTRNQLDRYVVSRKTNGEFVVNIYDKNNRRYLEKGVVKRLKVCKYCLAEISYKGYKSYGKTPHIYENFSLEEFFALYKSSQFQHLPRKTSENVPLNEYTSDFDAISDNYRTYRHWRCERCTLELKNDKRHLHVHHRNGLKWDNEFINLECLCLGCHAESSGHERMKFSHEYRDFMAKYEHLRVKLMKVNSPE